MRMGKTQKRMRNERWMIEKRYCLTWMEGNNRGQRIELKEGRVNKRGLRMVTFYMELDRGRMKE